MAPERIKFHVNIWIFRVFIDSINFNNIFNIRVAKITNRDPSKLFENVIQELIWFDMGMLLNNMKFLSHES